MASSHRASLLCHHVIYSPRCPQWSPPNVVLRPLCHPFCSQPTRLLFVEQGYLSGEFLIRFTSATSLTFCFRNIQGSNSKIDGSFVATVLESAAVGVLYLAWKSITEGESCYCFISCLTRVLPAILSRFVHDTSTWSQSEFLSPHDLALAHYHHHPHVLFTPCGPSITTRSHSPLSLFTHSLARAWYYEIIRYLIPRPRICYLRLSFVPFFSFISTPFSRASIIIYTFLYALSHYSPTLTITLHPQNHGTKTCITHRSTHSAFVVVSLSAFSVI